MTHRARDQKPEISMQEYGNPWRLENAEYDSAQANSAYSGEFHPRHPYAILSAEMADIEPDGVMRSEQPKPLQAAVEPMSLGDFDSGCRRILSQYVPALERPRLPSRYRDFIDRNRRRSAISRRHIYNGLRKYDLSEDLVANAQFNREDVAITEEKLRAIEQEVDREG